MSIVNSQLSIDLRSSLKRSAILGTERQKLQLPDSDGALGEMLACLPSEDAESTLLAAAGALAVYQRAGQKAHKVTSPLPPPADGESLARCSERAGQHLAVLLSGTMKEILPEWLTAAAASGLRVPERFLPLILDLGRRERRLRPLLLAVIGNTGRWLGGLNEDWNWAAGAAPGEEWETGSRDVRAAMLEEIRSSDPRQGRELLLSTWKEEGADDRAMFLNILRTGLGNEDEPFLEEALDDRSKEVRTAAADLLSHLPDSRLVRRMIDRAEPLIQLSSRSGNGTSIEVTLPNESSEAMIRDGLEKKARPGTGEKAWWMLQMLAAVPPRFWQDRWQLSPQSILSTFMDSEWELLLLEAWTLAADRHHDSDWSEALLRAWARKISADSSRKQTRPAASAAAPAVSTVPTSALPSIPRLIHIAVPLADSLPADRWNTLMHEAIHSEQCPLCKEEPLFLVLLGSSRPISISVGREIVHLFQRHIENTGSLHWQVAGELKKLTHRLPPELAPEAAAGWPAALKGPAESAIQEFISILQFRFDMLAELQAKSQ